MKFAVKKNVKRHWQQPGTHGGACPQSRKQQPSEQDAAVKDDLRTKGAMLFRCSGKCGWDVFVDCVDPRLPDGPIFCTECRTPSAAGMMSRKQNLDD